MVMDVHERFRTESHSQITGRFNERFLLSLASCETCIVVNDELDILPISSHMKKITAVPVQEDSEGILEAQRELKSLKEELKEDFPVGPLIQKCCTLDQGKAVATFLDAILDKTLRSTVALLAAHGWGKSAALGLAIAGAVSAGYSNIFVTAPSPENLKTLFSFVCKGFDMLQYKEHLDYDIVKSNNPEFKKSTMRINIYKQHRQTIQYILPYEYEKLSQVELLVVDEAAAIPLPVVKSLLGPYLVFLASTVNGYEGTGRSLSLKLLQQLEEQSHNSKTTDTGRLFKKIELTESIRYASADPIERWLNALLCLDVTNTIRSITRLPQLADCDLYYVNRDTLFSYHKDSELFLQGLMALYVASHYKNSPNDLQLMADAPAHHLFVLLGPVDESENCLPDILCVIQVCLEGQISRESAKRALSEGRQPFGDQIPWKFSQQFADDVFPSLSGARIVRIATHPTAIKLGYGSVAVELLTRYFEGQLTQLSELETEDALEIQTPQVNVTKAAEEVKLLGENIKPRRDLPPLLVPLRERRPERLHYLGVSFGLTLDLFRFWRKHKFAPFFIGNTPNSVTGEYTCMVLKPLKNDDVEADKSDGWGFYGPYCREYKRRLVELLGSTYRKMDYKLAMSIFDPKINFPASSASSVFIKFVLEPNEMKRLEAYSKSLVDYPLIRGIAQKLARLYFLEHFPVSLSYLQASILLCYGLQHKDIPDIEREMNVERHQVLALFTKVMKKLYKYLHNLTSKEIVKAVSRLKMIKMEPHAISVDEDLNDASKKVEDGLKGTTTMGLLEPELFQQCDAIADTEADFGNALRNGCGGASGVTSVKSNKSKLGKIYKKRNRSLARSKSPKKRKT